MDDASSLNADIAVVERWLDDPAALSDLMAELPYLRTPIEARSYVADLRAALEDVKQGRSVPHSVVLQDVADRQHRASAAE